MKRGDIAPLSDDGRVMIIARTSLGILTVYKNYFGVGFMRWTSDETDDFTRLVNENGEEYER